MKKDCCKFKAAQEKGEDESLGAGTKATTFENNKTKGEARKASPDPDSQAFIKLLAFLPPSSQYVYD